MYARNINVYILVLRLLLKTFTATVGARAKCTTFTANIFWMCHTVCVAVVVAVVDALHEYELNAEVYLPCT